MQAQFLAARQLYGFYQLQICPTGFCSGEALRWIRGYIPGFSGATLIWTSRKPARGSRLRSQPGESGLDFQRDDLAPIRKIPVSMGIPQPPSATKSQFLAPGHFNAQVMIIPSFFTSISPLEVYY